MCFQRKMFDNWAIFEPAGFFSVTVNQCGINISTNPKIYDLRGLTVPFYDVKIGSQRAV